MNLIFDYSIVVLISLNVVAIAFESVTSISQTVKGSLKIFEVFSVVIFSIEYLCRIYVSDLTHPSLRRSKSILKFVLSPYGIIDLLAILPFYLPALFSVDLRFIRVIRLIRFLRLLKINRYNDSFKLIATVIKEKRSELGMTFFIAILVLIISSFLIYYIEGEVQPDKFSSVFASLWWAIVTMTTIGYGDVFPITNLGKLLSGVLAVLGIGLVALPTGILSAGFVAKISKNRHSKRCPHCNKELYE